MCYVIALDVSVVNHDCDHLGFLSHIYNSCLYLLHLIKYTLTMFTSCKNMTASMIPAEKEALIAPTNRIYIQGNDQITKHHTEQIHP